MGKKLHKMVVEDLKFSFTLHAAVWQTTSNLPRETDYCATLLPLVVFREDTDLRLHISFYFWHIWRVRGRGFFLLFKSVTLSLSLLSRDHRLFFPALEVVMSLGLRQVRCCLCTLWSAIQWSSEEVVDLLQKTFYAMMD